VGSVATHDVGNLIFTVTDQGILGRLDQSQPRGSGFVYPAAGVEDILYTGSLWISSGDAYIANRDYD
jgi:hypothetical protein